MYSKKQKKNIIIVTLTDAFVRNARVLGTHIFILLEIFLPYGYNIINAMVYIYTQTRP